MAFVPVPQPYDFALSTDRYRVFGIDLACLWHEGGLHRVVGGREVRIEAAPGGVDVEPLDDETEPVVRTVLGLSFDLDAFAEWAAGDEALSHVVAGLRGFRPPLTPDGFEMLVGAVAAQQVSLFSAHAICNRFIERFGELVGEAWAFPTRERIARAREDDLFAVGFTRRKAEYIVALARSDLDFATLASLSDDEVRARITALRGLGDWTAEWFLARHLARPHAWPWGDLVLRKAVVALYRDLDVREASARFHPFQNLTAHYLLLSQRTP